MAIEAAFLFKPTPNGGDLKILLKFRILTAVKNYIDMKNESFSYLLPKSGSRSY